MASTNSIVNELLVWLKDNKLDLNSLEYLKLVDSSNDNEGRCVIASNDIPPQTVLVKIPNNLLINYQCGLSLDFILNFFEWIATLAQNVDSQIKKCYSPERLDALYLFILFERFNKTGQFYSFIASMPDYYDSPEYFCEESLSILPDLIKFSILKRIEKLKNKFNCLFSLLKEYIKVNSSQSLLLLFNNMNYDNFKWAFCSVNSRCFHVDEKDLSTKSQLKLAEKLFGI
jgi:hypothetical protein